MKRILITGNGFDLAQGLPTRYVDFIQVLNILKSDSLIVTDIKHYFNSQDISKNTKQIELFEKANPLEEKDLNSLKERLNNIWFNYFSNQLEIDTWIDFESKLESALLSIEKFIQFIRNVLFKEDQEYQLRFHITELLEKNSNIIQLLEIVRLISFPPEHESDTFVLNHKYCKFNRRAQAFCEFDEDKFYSFLNTEWEKFMKLFNDYLQVFVEPLISMIKCENVYDFDSHFTFNYTDTYKKILKHNVQTKHLHGSMNNSETSKIVMGFNRSESTKNKNLISFTKNYQRMIYNTDHSFLTDFKKGEKLNIYIWGHSLDITDKFFIDQIIYQNDILKNGNNLDVTLNIIYRSSYSKLLQNLIHIYDDDTINDLFLEKKIKFIEATSEVIIKNLSHDKTLGMKKIKYRIN